MSETHTREMTLERAYCSYPVKGKALGQFVEMGLIEDITSIRFH